MKTKATRRLAWQVLNALWQGERDFRDGRRPFEVETLIDALTRNGVDRDTIRAAMNDEGDRRHEDTRRRNADHLRGVRDKARRASGGLPPVKSKPAQWVIECLYAWNPDGGWHPRTENGGTPRYIAGQLRALRENEEANHEDPADQNHFRARLIPGTRPFLP
jgi:hypothetical protein